MNDAEAHLKVARDRTVRHEVGHLAALLMFGMRATEIWVWGSAGAVRGEVDQLGRSEARDLMKVILAGPICEGKRVPSWPFLKGVSGDEDNLLRLSEYLKLTEAQYEQLVTKTYYLRFRAKVRCAGVRLHHAARVLALRASPVTSSSGCAATRGSLTTSKGVSVRFRRKSPGPPSHVLIVGRTGRTERMAVTETPWWEQEEQKAIQELRAPERSDPGSPSSIADA